MHVSVCACGYVLVPLCVSVYVWEYACVCAYVWTYAFFCVRVSVRAGLRMCLCVRVDVSTCLCGCMHVDVCLCRCVHVSVYSLNGNIEISASRESVGGAKMLQDDADGIIQAEGDLRFRRIDIGGDDERVDALEDRRLSGGKRGTNGWMNK